MIMTIKKNRQSRHLSFSIFATKFLTKPRQIGSITPSSKFLASEMVKALNSPQCLSDQRLPSSEIKNIDLIELGAGTGTITSHLLHRKIQLVEIDEW